MEWINVEDRLPNIGDEILCYAPKGCTKIFSDEVRGFEDYDYGRRCLVVGYWDYPLSSDIDWFWGECITHWQPLPEPPKV